MTKSTKTSGFGYGGAALALFVNAGSIKAHPLLAWIEVDLTLLLAIVVAVLTCTYVIRSKVLYPTFLLPVIIGAIMVFGLATGITSDYGYSKMQSFLTLAMVGMIGAAVMLGDARQRHGFLTTLAWLGVTVALLVTVAPMQVSEWSGVATLAGTNTIATSRIILTGAIIVVSAAILAPVQPARKIAMAALCGLMILAALSTGSRGPILAAAIAVILALLIAPAFTRRRGRGILAVLTVAGIGLYMAAKSGDDGLGRITAFLAGEADRSAGIRSHLWQVATEQAVTHPAGIGWGAFASLPSVSRFAVADGTLYPHNVLLEVLLEGGWFMGLAFATLIIASSIRTIRHALTPSTVAMFSLLFFAIINAMLSGDINDNRLMWVLLVAAWARTSVGDGQRSLPTPARVGRAD